MSLDDFSHDPNLRHPQGFVDAISSEETGTHAPKRQVTEGKELDYADLVRVLGPPTILSDSVLSAPTNPDPNTFSRYGVTCLWYGRTYQGLWYKVADPPFLLSNCLRHEAIARCTGTGDSLCPRPIETVTPWSIYKDDEGFVDAELGLLSQHKLFEALQRLAMAKSAHARLQGDMFALLPSRADGGGDLQDLMMEQLEIY